MSPRLSLLILALAALPCWGCAAPAPAPAPEPQMVAKLADSRLNELSGLAASRRYPGFLWAHNDSGDSARLFLINSAGKTVAVVNLNGAKALDWEDMAIAGSGENAWIYVGDIGDNAQKRKTVEIYRLREPELDPQKLEQEISIAPENCEMKYPDGPRDCETLVATPDGDVVLVSKDANGSQFYRAPFENGKTQTLKKFAAFRFGAQGLFTRLTTGGDFSPDGRTLAVTTYTDFYLWNLPAPFEISQLDKIRPDVRELPPLKQCESLCFGAEGTSLWVASEGEGAPLWEIPAKITSEPEKADQK